MIKKRFFINLTLILIVAVAFFLCFHKLGKTDFETWDELTNVEVITRIKNVKDVFSLTTDRGLFFEKPPFWYITSYLTSEIIGITPVSMRMISALSGFLTILLVIVITSTVYSRAAAVISALVLLSTGQLFITNAGGFFTTHNLRSADADSLFIFLFLFSVGSFLMFVRKSSSLHFLYISVITSALSVLTKGPMGIIPFVYIIYYLLRNKKTLNNITIIKQFFPFFIIVLPWYLIMFKTHGNDFFQEHFFYHVFARLTTAIEGHSHPWWYYVSLLFNPLMFPAMEIFVLSLFLLSRKKDRVAAILIHIIFIVLAIISFSRTKLAWYMLPIYPLLAMVIGGFADKTVAAIKRGRKRERNKIIFYKIVIFYILAKLNVFALINVLRTLQL